MEGTGTAGAGKWVLGKRPLTCLSLVCAQLFWKGHEKTRANCERELTSATLKRTIKVMQQQAAITQQKAALSQAELTLQAELSLLTSAGGAGGSSGTFLALEAAGSAREQSGSAGGGATGGSCVGPVASAPWVALAAAGGRRSGASVEELHPARGTTPACAAAPTAGARGSGAGAPAGAAAARGRGAASRAEGGSARVAGASEAETQAVPQSQAGVSAADSSREEAGPSNSKGRAKPGRSKGQVSLNGVGQHVGTDAAPEETAHMGEKRKQRGSSRYVGVSWHKGPSKWEAYLLLDPQTKRKRSIGYYASEGDAARAHDRAAAEAHGPGAKLNFPSEAVAAAAPGAAQRANE
jgi:hypothetical protein